MSRRKLNSGRWTMVGANGFTEGGDDEAPSTLYIDDEVEGRQLKRLAETKGSRNDEAVRASLARIASEAADPTVNLMPALIDSVRSYATLGEIIHELEGVFGIWTEPRRI